MTNDSSEEEAFNRQALNVEERNPELKKDIAPCETALAPPPHNVELPGDVLRIIFDLVCPTVDPPDTVNFRQYPALTLSYVCSAWRCTILDMPHIWARFPWRVTIDTEHADPRTVSYMDFPRLRFIRIWLTRGGSLPRTELSIDHYDSDGLSSDMVKELVAPFTFQKLCLTLEYSELYLLRKIPPEHMLHLHTLRIGCYNSYRPYPFGFFHIPVPAGILCLPPQLPCLVDLTLCNCFGECREKLITTVPWHNLKELFLQFDIPATTCLNVILRQGMSLVSCALKPTSDAIFSSLPDIELPVVLPRMDILALRCSSQADAAKFECLLLTPAASIRRLRRMPTMAMIPIGHH